MENGEAIHLEKKDVDESGFSEKKSDQDIELQAGQWLDLTNKQRAANKKQQTGSKKRKSEDRKQKTVNKKSYKGTSSFGSSQLANKTQNLDNKDQAVGDLQKYSQELTVLIQQFVSLPSHSSKEAERITQNIFNTQARIKNILQALKRTS